MPQTRVGTAPASCNVRIWLSQPSDYDADHRADGSTARNGEVRPLPPGNFRHGAAHPRAGVAHRTGAHARRQHGRRHRHPWPFQAHAERSGSTPHAPPSSVAPALVPTRPHRKWDDPSKPHSYRCVIATVLPSGSLASMDQPNPSPRMNGFSRCNETPTARTQPHSGVRTTLSVVESRKIRRRVHLLQPPRSTDQSLLGAEHWIDTIIHDDCAIVL